MGRWRIEHTASFILNRQRRQMGKSGFAADKLMRADPNPDPGYRTGIIKFFR